ncbi:hypothetical protein TELCIR_11581 [Teladorsagia circumcincta]|uniref:small monomeric GTPase n=1 Tax=Teladorsagia circumcincta TaxID=45464 RepID=A0A2G9UAC4_TELCI|nr:hypothetical protein TELCIR_11581 [Teladorsagia circumcincta]
MHVALVGMTGSGKSAIAVKYITKRFIGEYDSSLEDTYCRQDTVAGQPLMVWMMDTVDDASRDEMRWLAWADVYLNILTGTRSPSPRLCSSDSEIVTPRKSAFSALRSTSRSGQVRSKAAKPVQLHKTPSLSKIKTGSKLLKLFHN